MIQRTANAIWQGDLKDGQGNLSFGDGAYSGAYSFSSRFEDGQGTNPEELIAAAHAGCYSMALSGDLAKAGYTAETIDTVATVFMDKGDDGFGINIIRLVTKARVPEIQMDEFADIATAAKNNCPVSKALASVEIRLEAHLLK